MAMYQVIVSPGNPNRMVTKGYQEGVYVRVTPWEGLNRPFVSSGLIG